MTKNRHHMIEKQAENRKRIAAYFKNNPFATQQQCAKELQLGQTTVFRHVDELRREMARKQSSKTN